MSVTVQDSQPVPWRVKNKNPSANRKGESIGTAFTSLSTGPAELPSRFSALKQELSKGHEEAILNSWNRLLKRLEGHTLPNIEALGSKLVPEVQYADIVANGGSLPKDVEAKLKSCGTLIVKGVVPRQQALEWKQQTKDYIKANPTTGGFPSKNIQVYEIYWSAAQLAARSHPNVLAAQRALNNAWSTEPDTPVVLSEPLSYADRLRIRTPGDRSFNLGPHLDGGSLERWEDVEYRKCYTEILKGNWENYDPFNVTPRLEATPDLYSGPGGCSVFRTYQGWLSLSDCAPTEGTLCVMPDLKASTAYLILRPFVKPNNAGGWEIDTTSPIFHGAAMGAGHELTEEEYPLIARTAMIPIPAVEPGDFVFWHCDVAHMVEAEHQGKEDGSIFYLATLPLCEINAVYTQKQREAFQHGQAPPDFPGGIAETKHVGRGSFESISPDGRAAMGFGPFSAASAATSGQRAAYDLVNTIMAK